MRFRSRQQSFTQSHPLCFGPIKREGKSIHNQEEPFFSIIDEGAALLVNHYTAADVLHRIAICRIQSIEWHLTALVNVVTLTMVHTKSNLFVLEKKRLMINNYRTEAMSIRQR
jgi:hypothetical protein